MGGAAAPARGAERLAPLFAGDASHAFLCEGGETWTVGRLLAYAADVERLVPGDAGPIVAVRSHSAAFVIASLLGLWKSGRAPLLVDPALRTDSTPLGAERRRLPVMAPAQASDPWADLAVEESGTGPIVPVFPAAGHDEVAFFTSGSTGEPKIVRKRAYQLGEQHAREAPWLGLTGPVSVLCLVPAFHILGYIYGFSTPAAGGGRTAFFRGGTPQAWLEQIRGERPGLVVGVPSHYRLLTRIITDPLPAATYLCSGGALDPAIVADFEHRAGSTVLQVYGSTETGGIATRSGAGDWEPFPDLGWESRASDGRLLIRSAWQDYPERWLATDDVVAVEGGRFRLLGRADSVVKIGGRRFSTGEVVQAALATPGVEQAHAVVYSRFGEPAVALFVVPTAQAPLPAADVRQALSARLAPFKVPRTIQVLPELPTRGIGKVDETALRSLADGGDEQQAVRE